MTEEWTEGPWEVAEDTRGIERVYAGDSEIVRALSTHGIRRLPERERAANRHLIGAGKDLYRELILAVEIIKEHVPADALGQGGGICPEPGHPDQVWSIKEESVFFMERALAKARGELS